MGYIAITICKNEGDVIRETVEHVLNLSPPPEIYVVVDEESQDNTLDVLESFGSKIDVLRYTRHENMDQGANMAYAFMKGVNYAEEKFPDWNYLLKVDADNFLPENYCSYLIELMEDIKCLGIVSGNPKGRDLWKENPTDGAKLYRRECWDDIGGLFPIYSFDTHAIYKAKMLGWKVHVFPIFLEETRKPTVDDKPQFKYWYTLGRVRKILGFGFLHTFLNAVKRSYLTQSLIGGMIMIFSFLLYNFSSCNSIFTEAYYSFMQTETKKEIQGKIVRYINLAGSSAREFVNKVARVV